ncbi:hypothetical protein GCM10027431_01260 [Lysobacter rhizosphaerae]
MELRQVEGHQGSRQGIGQRFDAAFNVTQRASTCVHIRATACARPGHSARGSGTDRRKLIEEALAQSVTLRFTDRQRAKRGAQRME